MFTRNDDASLKSLAKPDTKLSVQEWSKRFSPQSTVHKGTYMYVCNIFISWNWPKLTLVFTLLSLNIAHISHFAFVLNFTCNVLYPVFQGARDMGPMPTPSEGNKRSVERTVCASLLMIVDGDEKWILCDNPRLSSRQTPKPTLSLRKVVSCVWWYCFAFSRWNLEKNLYC